MLDIILYNDQSLAYSVELFHSNKKKKETVLQVITGTTCEQTISFAKQDISMK
jgi:hypothetical protein